MLPPYKATLLHLSSFPAPAVTAAWYCLPIQLSDDWDSTKTRLITLLLAEQLPAEAWYGNALPSLCLLYPEDHIWSHAWLEAGVLSQKVTLVIQDQAV